MPASLYDLLLTSGELGETNSTREVTDNELRALIAEGRSDLVRWGDVDKVVDDLAILGNAGFDDKCMTHPVCSTAIAILGTHPIRGELSDEELKDWMLAAGASSIGTIGGGVAIFKPGGKPKFEMGPNKFEYIFGRVSSSSHSAARSKQLNVAMSKLGIYDTLEGRTILSEPFEGVVKAKNNVIRSFETAHGSFEVRESLFLGPSGVAIKLETTYKVLDNGTRVFTTVIPFAGAK